MLFPRLESICSLLRTVQVAFAVVRLAELMYLLAGGWVRVQEHLPREPFPVFGQPPLCLFFGWRCCARRITDRDIYFMALGMRQFAVVAPVAGTVDTCAHIARLYSARAPASEWSVAFVFLQVLTALYSATTLIGMWSFNNLYSRAEQCPRRPSA
ncbi:unnamed protein product [Prorocentrum cordatum]|uniref:Very-long-chain (3R)-3-hydroxyacyl-CoA dehydratase n=1 Tax=Prorocentrum cordatum TaxID=2364126 RepID=A0ABN9QDR6_9DINO|nr:unnamed protein product [Polarella glacialis]